ncbi:MAG TPA: uL30 family ribosomal protein [Nitrososphaerales archaeon]|nr:uL30 family ribosomal protein [Nitrososphaerales archaeon]
MALLLVVNLRGKINSSQGVRRALSEMRVERKFTATVVTDEPSTLGMLKSCKDFIAWTPIDGELLSSLLEKRGMLTESKRLDGPALSKLGFGKHSEVAEMMIKEQKRLASVRGIRPFFRLSPPRGGFKSSLRRQATERGTLGANPGLTDIVRRMI